jgi:hypothetical protein
MMTWLALPISPLGTCSTISSPPKAPSPQSILKTTLNTCVEHGIPNNLLDPCSSRFKIAPIIQRQEASLSDTHSKSTLDMQKIFATGNFMSACCRWNEKLLAEKTWAQFKAHFSAAHRQHKQMQGESAATAGYHSTNAAVGQTEDQMAEATLGALANLATGTAADRGAVATLTEANARLVKQLEDNSNELLELKDLIKKERFEKRGQRSLNPSPKKLLLDSRLQSRQYSHKFELQLPQTGTQTRVH